MISSSKDELVFMVLLLVMIFSFVLVSLKDITIHHYCLYSSFFVSLVWFFKRSYFLMRTQKNSGSYKNGV